VPCEPCTTQNPIAGVRAAKSSDIGDGTAAHQGQEITYTLTVNVAGGNSDLATKLTDTLGDSLEFIGFTDKGKFTATNSGNSITAILPAGTAPGDYRISYKAAVKKDATADAHNSAAAEPSDNDGNPPKDKNGNIIPADQLPKVPCRPCVTTNPLQNITVSKSASPADGKAVQVGDIITYTLNVSVSGKGITPLATLLTDTLDNGLEFVKITDAGKFKADTSAAPVLKFILPSGAPANANYTISYQARIKPNAKNEVKNSVVAAPADNNGNPPTDKNGQPIPPNQLPNIPCNNCEVKNPLIGINVSKEATPPAGTAVKRGDIIAYRLTAKVDGPEGTATLRNILLTDTMNASLQPIGAAACGKSGGSKMLRGSLGDNNSGGNGGGAAGSGTVSGQSFTVSLPAGTAPGTYTYCYTARVLLNAAANAQNNVVPVYVDGSGNPVNDPNLPAIPCPVCSVEHPLSEVKVAKTSDIGDGAQTKPGADIVYKLTATVSGGATDQAALLTDSLGANLDFAEIVDAGKFKADTSAAPALKFILPAGTPVGSYAISYRAHVKANASGKADNSVTAAWSDDNGNPPLDPDGRPIPPANQPPIPCQPCVTSNPLTEVKVAKTSDIGDGVQTKPGADIVYKLTATVGGGTGNQAVLLTDSLGANLDFAEIVDAGKFKADTSAAPVLKFILPSGTDAGTYAVSYRVKVREGAEGKADNSVTAAWSDNNGNPPLDPSGRPIPPENQPKIPCEPCVTSNPLTDVKVAKTSDIGDGAHTKPGADIVYKLTATVSGSGGNQAVLLTDTLGANLDFAGIVDAGKFKADTSAAPVLKFILPSGTDTGTYAVSYRVKVREDAVGKADNSVTAAWSDNNGNPPLDPSGRPIPPENQPKIPCRPCATSNPLDADRQDIAITKAVGIRAIRRGEQAPYTIRVTNNGAAAVNGLRVVDTAPSGFRFVNKSASIDGKAAEPKLAGRNVIFENLTLAPKQTIEIHLNMLALSSAAPDEYTNRAHAEDANGRRLTEDAKATVEILAEHVFDCADVIGTVFDDANRNGYQDDGEQGLAGVRLATAKGWIITTDAYGRYHIPCAALPDSRIGSNFIVKLDPRSLPSGYRITTENPRVVRLTAGKMTKINFGASISRVVRLDLRRDAFEPQQTALKPQWRAGINRLIEVLDKEQSVLRLSYSDDHADKSLAQARISGVERLIREIWSSRKGRYRLEIETRVKVGG